MLYKNANWLEPKVVSDAGWADKAAEKPNANELPQKQTVLKHTKALKLSCIYNLFFLYITYALIKLYGRAVYVYDCH